MKYRFAAIIYITLLALIELALLVWLVYSFAVQKKPLDENIKPLILFIGYTLTLAKIFTGRHSNDRNLFYYEDRFSEQIGEAFRNSKSKRRKLVKAVKDYHCDKFQNAIKTLQALLHECETNDDEIACRYFIAECYRCMRALNRAVEGFNEVISIDMSHHYSYLGLGFAYDSLYRYDDAISAFEKATLYKRDLMQAYYGLANTYGKVGEYSSALENALKAHELSPDSRQVNELLSVIYGVAGDEENMNKYMKKAIQLGSTKTKLTEAVRYWSERDEEP